MSRWEGDEREELLEGEDEEELEGEWELDPNDPTHPDYDLSEAAGYGGWEAAPKPLLLRRGVILIVTLLVIIGLMVPFVWLIVE
jgi:hypothetical protein